MLVRKIEKCLPILAQQGVGARPEIEPEHATDQLAIRRQFLRGEIACAELAVNRSGGAHHFKLAGGINPCVRPTVGAQHRTRRAKGH